MKPPYKMSRTEWIEVRETLKVQGSSIFKANRVNIASEILRINKLSELTFGVQGWLHEKACYGSDEALELLMWGYDVYEQILIKAKEEGLI